ncbi:MAG TPA: glutamate racemase [Chthoniobacterales bacterium]|nr:glutamate racemase [Chthoniobacterales bacterium]
MSILSRKNSIDDGATQPVGVFDSGIGGLTVVHALRKTLPAEDIFYLGDTARLPYGTKNQATIERYSVEIAGLLLSERAKIIVVACNTASALALPRLQNTLRVPVIGVIAPGARAAAKTTKSGRIGVIGTRATMTSGAYEQTIQALRPDATVISQPCPLLVPLIEEGMFRGPIVEDILHLYLDPLLFEGVDTLVLGCTHYPLLAPLISEIAGEGVNLVDSAENCATAVAQLLKELNLLNTSDGLGRLDVALTDESNPFLQTAERELALAIDRLEKRLVQGVTLVIQK